MMVVVIIAWFAILFTRHYPRGMFEFVEGVIRQLVETFQRHYPHLHVLINNAGAAFPGRRRATVDGVEMTFAVNYLASSPSVEGMTGKYFFDSHVTPTTP